jgi:hypothetical protein
MNQNDSQPDHEIIPAFGNPFTYLISGSMHVRTKTGTKTFPGNWYGAARYGIKILKMSNFLGGY